MHFLQKTTKFRTMLHPYNGKEYTLGTHPETIDEFQSKDAAEQAAVTHQNADQSLHYYVSRTPTAEWQKKRDLMISSVWQAALHIDVKVKIHVLKKYTIKQLEELLVKYEQQKEEQWTKTECSAGQR